jgi:hypothetical protein
MLGCGYMYISLVGVAGRRQCQCMQLTMADVSTNIDDKGRPRRCPSACTIARTSFPQPRTNTRTNTDINLSSASRILLCAALIDRLILIGIIGSIGGIKRQQGHGQERVIIPQLKA